MKFFYQKILDLRQHEKIARRTILAGKYHDGFASSFRLSQSIATTSAAVQGVSANANEDETSET